jgi:sugar phosphate isomerase/epimerase
VASVGFTLTEISHPGLLPLSYTATVRDHALQLGVAIHAVHAPPMRRDPTLDRQRQAARLAAELGATVLVVHVSSLRFASLDPAIRAAARDRDLRRLEALAVFCHPLGITLGLENGKHPHHATYLLDLLDALESEAPRQLSPPAQPATHALSAAALQPAPVTPNARRPTPPGFGLVFDSGHAALGGDPVTVARAMLPRLVHTHLHDNHGRRDEHLPPGDGTLDWPALLGCLTVGGYAGPLLVELRPHHALTPDDWRQQLTRARNLLSAALR